MPPQNVGQRIKCPACGLVQVVPGAAPGVFQASELNLESVAAALSRGEVIPEHDRPRVSAPAVAPAADGDFGIAPPVELPRDERFTPVNTGKPRRCPSCETEYPGTAKICVACGVDLKTGRALITTQDENLDTIYVWAENIVKVISFGIWAGIYPIASEAFGVRKPWVIRSITLATVIISIGFFAAYDWTNDPAPGVQNLMLWSGDREAAAAALRQELEKERRDLVPIPNDVSQPEREQIINELINSHLGEYRGYQLITHAFLHGGFEHLIGNMIFLYVLGTRVNALIGNLLTLILYPLLAVLAATWHLIAMQHAPAAPLVGASGAIMGLAGMYLVLMPTPQVHYAAWFRNMFFVPIMIHRFLRLSYGNFSGRGFWLVITFVALDTAALYFGWVDQTAHWAHLGGFVSGVIIACILLFTRLVNARGGDIFNAMLGRRAWKLVGKPNRPGLTLW